MDQTLNDFVLNLLADPEAMAAFQLDPQQVLDSAGLGDLTPEDVQEVVPLVMDSVGASGWFAGSTDSAAGGLSVDTPFGPVTVENGAALDPGNPMVLGGIDSPLGGGMLGASKYGASMSADLDFSAVTDPGDGLDLELPAEGLRQDIADGLTDGARTAGDMLTGGAAVTAGLLDTGAELAAGALTDPAGATEALLGSLPPDLNELPVDLPDLPVDLPDLPVDVPEVPVDVPGAPAPEAPVGGPDLPVDVPDLPVDLPVDLPGGLPVELPDLPVDLPLVDDLLGGDLLGGDLLGGDLLGGDLLPSGLNVDETLDTVDGAHADVVNAVNDSPVGDVAHQAGLADVVNGSPVGDLLGLAEPGAATDIVRDTLDLDLGL